MTTATFDDTLRTLVISGRPLRVKANDYIKKWEAQPELIKKLTDSGVTPYEHDLNNDNETDVPHLMGQVAAVITDIKPAKEIVDEMVSEAKEQLALGANFIGIGAKL